MQPIFLETIFPFIPCHFAIPAQSKKWVITQDTLRRAGNTKLHIVKQVDIESIKRVPSYRYAKMKHWTSEFPPGEEVIYTYRVNYKKQTFQKAGSDKPPNILGKFNLMEREFFIPD